VLCTVNISCLILIPRVNLGPLLFNVFINDIFYFVKKGTLYNYADDNTLSYGHPDFNVFTSVLESESNVLINWLKVSVEYS
jgi:hypothetical protein